MSADRENPLFIGVLAKCFQVLEALNTAARPVGLTELAELTGLGRSAVQRITFTLRALGYLRQDPASRAFAVSGRMLEFGHTALQTHRVRELAQPHLEALNRRCGETVNLMELEGQDIVYVARYPSLHAVSVDLHVGSRLPAYCTAAGRAILATWPQPEALALLRATRRVAMTSHAVTDLEGLMARLQQARRAGYALNDQEAFVGDISVAAPLFDAQGRCLAAMNIAVPTPRWTLDDVIGRLVPQLLRAAAVINKDLRRL